LEDISKGDYPPADTLVQAMPHEEYATGILAKPGAMLYGQPTMAGVMGGISAPSEPQVNTGSNGRTRVKHRTYIGTPVGSSTLLPTRYMINPGMEIVAPWAAPICNRFQFYKLVNFSVEYIPRVSVTSSGQVALAADFNLDPAIPDSTQELLANPFSVTAPVYQGAVWPHVDSSGEVKAYHEDLAGQFRKKRTRSFSIGHDKARLYDSLYFYFATQGTTGVLGDLFFNYEIELYVPHIPNPYSVAESNSFFKCNAAEVGTGATSLLVPASFLPECNGLSLRHSGDSGGGSNAIHLPKGVWRVQVHVPTMYGTGIANQATTVSIYTGTTGSPPTTMVASESDTYNNSAVSSYGLTLCSEPSVCIMSTGDATVEARVTAVGTSNANIVGAYILVQRL